MKALKVYINGERICTASLGDEGHVSADATLIGNGDDAGWVSVSGFDGSQNHHVKWCFRQLQIGDEVRIVLEEAEQIDQPNERKTVEEEDRWARSLRPEGKAQEDGQDDLPPLPAPWE
ncbi:MAG TPA: hypothetical protein VMG10_11955 [Gemmataceae bacterium]|nr:hypothetical protein [Gemmataceae bacterium]